MRGVSVALHCHGSEVIIRQSISKDEDDSLLQMLCYHTLHGGQQRLQFPSEPDSDLSYSSAAPGKELVVS